MPSVPVGYYFELDFNVNLCFPVQFCQHIQNPQFLSAVLPPKESIYQTDGADSFYGNPQNVADKMFQNYLIPENLLYAFIMFRWYDFHLHILPDAGESDKLSLPGLPPPQPGFSKAA